MHPLAKPAVAVTALFSFMTGWNEFIQAATFMNKEEMYTGPVGLRLVDTESVRRSVPVASNAF